MYPSVGAVRRSGTTVIIEDVAFPLDRLGEAVVDLQALFVRHGYPEAIIFGHAGDGNLHFVITQSFNDAAAVDQYARFMDDVVALVVGKYDGALKAEHGTGRNMAPFVETEWGPEALAVMTRLKALADPRGVLNPGVILNADPRAHLRRSEDVAVGRRRSRHLRRVRFLRARVPLARPDADAAPAHRRAPRDGAPRAGGRRPRRARRALAGLRLRGSRYLRRRRHVRHGVPGGHQHGRAREAVPRRASLLGSRGAQARSWPDVSRVVETMVKVGLRAGHVVQRVSGGRGDAGDHSASCVALPARRCRCGPAAMPRRRAGAAARPARRRSGRLHARPACRVCSAACRRAIRCRCRCRRRSSPSRPAPASRCGSPPMCTGTCCGTPFSSKGFAAGHRHAANDAIERCWAWSDERSTADRDRRQLVHPRPARMRTVTHAGEPHTAGAPCGSWTAWSLPIASCCRT